MDSFESFSTLSDSDIKPGLMGAYTEYKTSYQKSWRQGGESGAASVLVDRPAAHQDVQHTSARERPAHTMPTPTKFSFFFTLTFWIAVIGLIGALLLTSAAYHALWDMGERINPKLVKWIEFFGDFMYTLASYLGYVQLINMPESDAISYVVGDWARINAMVHIESAIGTFAYLVGMIVWDVAALVEILPGEVEGLERVLLVKIPFFLGGICFAIGGACEVVHNRRKGPRFLEWWTAFLNCVGGFFFLASTLLGFFPGASFASSLCTAVGMSLFTITGVMFITMWRGNDFGLTFFRNLNNVMRAGRTVRFAAAGGDESLRIVASFGVHSLLHSSQNQEKSLSTRGVIFVVLYCWLFACSLMNCASSVLWDESKPRHITNAIESLLWMLIVVAVLLIHSAVATVPNQQPYRLAYMMARGTLFLAAVSESIKLCGWTWIN